MWNWLASRQELLDLSIGRKACAVPYVTFACEAMHSNAYSMLIATLGNGPTVLKKRLQDLDVGHGELCSLALCRCRFSISLGRSALEVGHK